MGSDFSRRVGEAVGRVLQSGDPAVGSTSADWSLRVQRQTEDIRVFQEACQSAGPWGAPRPQHQALPAGVLAPALAPAPRGSGGGFSPRASDLETCLLLAA